MILNEKELEEINTKHMFTSDKWFRMYCGFSSKLMRYKNGIAHIAIHNTEKVFKSDESLAKKVLTSWTNTLGKIKGFVIYIYKTNCSTGFVISLKDIDSKIIKDELTKIKIKEKNVLANLFSTKDT